MQHMLLSLSSVLTHRTLEPKGEESQAEGRHLKSDIRSIRRQGDQGEAGSLGDAAGTLGL